MKDNFSKQSDLYVKFRPTYPQELYDFLLSQTPNRSCAWDCGTGNGQVANVLADHFEQVYASDISHKQIKNAIQRDNVAYEVCPAQDTPYFRQSVDLITVGQAAHWFNHNLFCAEVRRVSRPDTMIAIWGYGLLRVNNAVDAIVSYFYKQTTGSYWDRERQHIDTEYATIPFPWEAVQEKNFSIKANWTVDQLVGYLKTWSAVQHYIAERGVDPVDEIVSSLEEAWGNEALIEVDFPVFLKMGRVFDMDVV